MTGDRILLLCCFLLNFQNLLNADDADDEDPFTTTDPKKREPSPCEICKFFVTELRSRLDESARSKEVIETGHGLDKKKKFKYLTSELRLTEALHEPHICEKILEYNVHAERKGSLRYAKGMSETMQTLHGLVNKGVKVELGIPYELWDKPSAEVSKMHRACFTFAEQYEETIEDWYYHHQNDVDLFKYLCSEQFLKGKDQKCLDEIFKPKGDGGGVEGEKHDKAKKKKKKSDKDPSDPRIKNEEKSKTDVDSNKRGEDSKDDNDDEKAPKSTTSATGQQPTPQQSRTNEEL